MRISTVVFDFTVPRILTSSVSNSLACRVSYSYNHYTDEQKILEITFEPEVLRSCTIDDLFLEHIAMAVANNIESLKEDKEEHRAEEEEKYQTLRESVVSTYY